MLKKFLIILGILLSVSVIFALFRFDDIEKLIKTEENLPYSIFAIHLDPQTANDKMFMTLKEFIESADEYKIKLTLMFTPQWGEMILSDAKKLNMVRQWETNGHEISVHHHGPSHPATWDGFTNAENWKELRKKLGKKEAYLGNMENYMDILKKLPKNGIISSGTITDKCTDYVEEILYDADGHFREPEGTTVIRTHLYNNTPAYRILINVLRINETRLIEIENEYIALKKHEIMGVVTHAANFAGEDKELILGWFNFLYDKDPQGKFNKTITDLMKNNILKNNELPMKECGLANCNDELWEWIGQANCN